MMLISVITIVSSCSSKQCLYEEEKPLFSASLSKGACFGTCPVYSAVVKGSGDVELEATAYVEPLGRHTGTVTPEQLCEIVTLIGRSDFFSVSDTMAPIADLPVTTMKINYHGKEHSVSWNSSVPDQLAGLHNALIKATYDNPTIGLKKGDVAK